MTPDKAAYNKAYLVKWRAENRERIHQYMRDNKGRWPAQTRQVSKQRTPEAIAARDALNNAVRLKKVIKPSKCEACEATVRLHGHHDDYSKPLDVRWLCTPCHVELHRNQRNGL